MSTTTPSRGYAYPQSTDAPDVPAAMQDLALDIDADVQTQVGRITTVEGATTGKPLVRLIQQSAQTLASGSPTALTFGSGSEDIDTHNYHDVTTNNSRVTPTKAGYYRVTVTLVMGTGATNYSQLVAVVAKNGTRVDPAVVTRPDLGTSAGGASATAIVSLNGSTDYVEGWGQQNSGGNNPTSASSPFRSTLEVEYLRPN